MKIPTMYCKHCGKIVDVDSKFCRYCGGELGCELSGNHRANSISQNVVSKDGLDSLGNLVSNYFRKIKGFASQYKWNILSFLVGIVVIGVLFFLGLEYEKFRALYWICIIILTPILFYFCFLKSVKIALLPMAVLVIAYSIFINQEWQYIYGARTDFFDKVKREFYLLFPNFKIPYGVTSIGNYAFEDCENLRSVTIPNSVTEIGDDAFAGCRGLKSVYISDLSAWCKIKFHDWTANPLVYAGRLYLIGELVTNITIPSDVFEIKDWTFRNCENLTNVVIPNGITSIGDGSFLDCCNLTSVTIPNSVKSIGGWAFNGCKGLNRTIIGRGVTYIGQDAFDNCTGELIVNCNIPDGEYRVSGGIFNGSKFAKVTIGNSVTRIGDYAFDGCDSITEVTIGNRVTTIGTSAFYGCNYLTTITISSSVTSIGRSAFAYCDQFAEVYCKPTIPPIGVEDMFLELRATVPCRKIYVPRNSVCAYKSYWRDNGANIVGYDF